MPNDPRATVLRFLEEFHAAGTPDFQRLGAYFSAKGYYQPLVPAIGRIEGPEAIAAALAKQYQTYYECRCEVHAAAAAGRFVFTERTDHVTLVHADRKVGSRVCAVFEVGEDGRIDAWREYWDTGDVAAQMGISPADVIGAASA
jgi:limonene-1,2-epoxide hydrolase